MSSEKEKPDVRVIVESSDFWWVAALVILFIVCQGDPDLMDVLQEWCRRYLESTHVE